jgi:hypothetical protein
MDVASTLIRFWTPIDPAHRFSAVGLEYLRSLVKSELRVRAISTMPGHIDDETPWGEVKTAFAAPHGEGPFVNVVCSDQPDDLMRLWTTDVYNLAITAVPQNGRVSPNCLLALHKFSLVAAPTEIHRVELAKWDWTFGNVISPAALPTQLANIIENLE